MESRSCNTNADPGRTVRIIPATKPLTRSVDTTDRSLRVAAYCRVSTEMEEQLNSYAVQTSHYTEKIKNTPNWEFAGIFADKGISGTGVKNRDEFNRMIRYCKRGRIDLILTKSISRFARNTLDCIKYVRILKELGIDVYFEEQGIHSIKPGSEFLIAVFGSQAQAESENLSANIRWGKDKAAEQGNVPFPARLYGFIRHSDGSVEIDEEKAAVVRRINCDFLSGDSGHDIKRSLEADGIPSPDGKPTWRVAAIYAILTNEKYAGDFLTNKTFCVDCLTKKVQKNNGERVQYYIEDHHPAIIPRAIYQKVQEEIARRASLEPKGDYSSPRGTGQYCSKYLLTEILICGCCGAHYKRVNWNRSGQRKVVWRCINRVQGGPKRCTAPTIEEKHLHAAIMDAVMPLAKQDENVITILKEQIRAGIQNEGLGSENIETLTKRIALLDTEIDAKISSVTADNIEDYQDSTLLELLQLKKSLEKDLESEIAKTAEQEGKEERVQEALQITEMLKNHPMKFDDKMLRKILKKVEVLSTEEILITFTGGLQVVQKMQDTLKRMPIRYA